MNAVATLFARFLVTVLAITAVVGQLAYLDAISGLTLGLSNTLGQSGRPAFFSVIAAHAVVSAVAGFLAVALAMRGDREKGAQGLAIALAAWAYMLAYSGVGILLRPEAGIGRGIFDAHFPLIELVGLAGLLRFTALFPRPLGQEDLAAPDSLPIGLRTVQHVRRRLLAPAAPWIGTAMVLGTVLILQMARGGALSDIALSPAMNGVRLGAIILVVLNLRHSWHATPAEDRDGLWWMLVGLALLVGVLMLLIGGNILFAATGWPEPSIAWRPILLDMGVVGFLWGLSMGVFYQGVLSGRATAIRVVAFSMLGALTLIFATSLEVLLSGNLVSQISLPPGLGAAGALLAVTSTSGRSLPWLERLITPSAILAAETAEAG